LNRGDALVAASLPNRAKPAREIAMDKRSVNFITHIVPPMKS
jgi:hypothetical protein